MSVFKTLPLIALLLAGCSGETKAGGPPKRAPRPFAVQVAPVESRSVDYTLNALGTVEAFERIQVTARVGGALDRVKFTEGDKVSAGQVLAEIDPARFEVALASAKAQQARALAAVKEQEDALKRRLAANEASPGLVREDEIAQLRTRIDVLKADEALAKVAVERAGIDVRDAYVRAPVAGIIETRSAQTGQYVQPGAVLATLVRRDPLLVRFKVPDSDARLLSPGHDLTFRVRGATRELTARITHVPEAADPATRMVLVTARVTDEQRSELVSGAFAEVTIPVGSSRQSPVVPQGAVRPSERGFLAYVVEGETAKERVLQLGLRTRDGLVEVRDGLTTGETLVVRGAEALRDGAAVQVASPRPASASGREPGGPTEAAR